MCVCIWVLMIEKREERERFRRVTHRPAGAVSSLSVASHTRTFSLAMNSNLSLSYYPWVIGCRYRTLGYPYRITFKYYHRPSSYYSPPSITVTAHRPTCKADDDVLGRRECTRIHRGIIPHSSLHLSLSLSPLTQTYFFETIRRDPHDFLRRRKRGDTATQEREEIDKGRDDSI